MQAVPFQLHPVAARHCADVVRDEQAPPIWTQLQKPAASEIVMRKFWVPVPNALVAVSVTSVVPAAVGVPMILLPVRDKPAGSGAAVKDVGVLVAVIL